MIIQPTNHCSVICGRQSRTTKAWRVREDLHFTEGQAGTSALYALLILVLTGIIGRLLDIWQARVIAKEANFNGVGIVQVVEERLRELEQAIERLRAGTAPHFN